jgi:3-keto-L-gulonate-6-phosphate decarboxylase
MKNEKLSDTVELFHEFFPNNYLVADLKTLTGARVEVDVVANAGVDAAIVSAQAPLSEINEFFRTCRKHEIDSWLDALETPHDKIWATLQLNESPTGVIIRSDPNDSIEHQRVTWMLMTQIKKTKLTSGLLTAAAGDLNLVTVPEVRRFGADIVIIKKSIYQSDNPQRAITRFLFLVMSNQWEFG